METKCLICSKEIKIKDAMELNEKYFCSSTCLSKYREEIGERQFDKESLATFEKKKSSGWIPERALKYIHMCQSCNKKLRETCKSLEAVSGASRFKIAKTETMEWCCHARFNLSSALADGTVPIETAQKVQKLAEDIAKDPSLADKIVRPDSLKKKLQKPDGLHGITTVLYDLAFAELAVNTEYKKLEENPPAVEGENMFHYAACLECDPVFGAECEEQAVEKEVNECVDKVQAMTNSLWCQHALHSMSALLLNKNVDDERMKGLINLAEKVAEEKGHPGVTTSDMFIALGRAAT
ncbi:MAG: hypothetical protein D6734_00550 [Candidatus Schekmanbacteria bacterium]|nr:MAG: hypothetical protein D6734_00550 [Candidatus Schekmanbacteria bacterium]